MSFGNDCCCMKKFRETYTIEEIEALKAWFDEHRAEIPPTLSMQAMEWTDVPKAIDYLIPVAMEECENPTFAGQTKLLFRLKEMIEAKQFD